MVSLFSLYSEEDRLFKIILNILISQEDSSLGLPTGLITVNILLMSVSQKALRLFRNGSNYLCASHEHSGYMRHAQKSN